MAIAIEILLAAAVLLAFGLAAAGRIDGMSRAVPDAPPGLPPGPVTPEGLRRVLLPVVVRGYRMADVDEVLERAAQELEAARCRESPSAASQQDAYAGATYSPPAATPPDVPDAGSASEGPAGTGRTPDMALEDAEGRATDG